VPTPLGSDGSSAHSDALAEIILSRSARRIQSPNWLLRLSAGCRPDACSPNRERDGHGPGEQDPGFQINRQRKLKPGNV
jgi:hypothetical protein